MPSFNCSTFKAISEGKGETQPCDGNWRQLLPRWLFQKLKWLFGGTGMTQMSSPLGEFPNQFSWPLFTASPTGGT